MTEETGTAIAIPQGNKLIELFKSEDGIEKMLEKTVKDARAEAANHDPTTRKGREALKSLAFRASKGKTTMKEEGLALTATMREEIAKINAGRDKGIQILDDLRKEIRKPVEDWEADEQKRIDALEERLSKITASDLTALSPSSEIEARKAEIEAIDLGDDWGDRGDDALVAKETAMIQIEGILIASKKREADEMELAALREKQAAADAKAEADAAERKRLEDELAEKQAADEAREQAERDRIEAEAREKAEAEKRHADHITDLIARITEIDQEEKIGGESAGFDVLLFELRNIKGQVEQLGREDFDRIEAMLVPVIVSINKRKTQAEEQRRADEEAAAAERAAQAKADAESAAQAVRDRIAAEEQRAKDDLAARKKTIGNIASDLQELPINLEDEDAILIATAAIDGKIPSLKVIYD